METPHKHKALPPLGRTLDMRDSRPAEKLSTGACGMGFPRPTAGTDRAALSQLQMHDRGSRNTKGELWGIFLPLHRLLNADRYTLTDQFGFFANLRP